MTRRSVLPKQERGRPSRGYPSEARAPTALADRGIRLEYARDLLERAVKLEPKNAAYLDSYGWVYFRLGDLNKAINYLTQAAELTSDATIFDHLGDAYSAQGNPAEARVWWQKALDIDPQNASIADKLKE